ncbi:MAG: hypothetical protein JO258_03840 [Alphaproteobacteria bacterium]|nr:hypothetical protein [Alphaproteobacteria bacterium]
MAVREALLLALAAGFVTACGGAGEARAQTVLQPIPAAECQTLTVKAQDATGFKMTASEDDFTDLTDGAEGRACHIAGSAADQTFAAPAELMAKLVKVFAEWKEDPARADEGPGGAEKGFVSGNRIATVEVSWEPGPGVVCSDKQPHSACNIRPQQKLWTAIIDIVE